jgi:hypothetical protein
MLTYFLLVFESTKNISYYNMRLIRDCYNCFICLPVISQVVMVMVVMIVLIVLLRVPPGVFSLIQMINIHGSFTLSSAREKKKQIKCRKSCICKKQRLYPIRSPNFFLLLVIIILNERVIIIDSGFGL